MIDGEEFSADSVEAVGFDEPEVMKVPTEQADADTLELKPEDIVPAAEDEQGDEPKDEKRRGKPAHQRIAELTAKMREAERRAEEAEAKIKPATEETAELVEPDPAKYEFGEADPKYLKDMARYEVKKELADERQRETDKAKEAKDAEFTAGLDRQWAEKATKAVEKYPDFAEKVLETAAAGDWPCPPLMAAAISVSDVGTDVAYHLATNPKEAEAIAAQLAVDPMRAAEQFGFIEGGFMDKAPESPGANAHPIDMAIHAGRLRAFLSKQDKPAAVTSTNAPEPPAHRVKGGNGQYKSSPDTDDLAAFERDHGKELGIRQ